MPTHSAPGPDIQIAVGAVHECRSGGSECAGCVRRTNRQTNHRLAGNRHVPALPCPLRQNGIGSLVVAAEFSGVDTPAEGAPEQKKASPADTEKQAALKERALADTGVQALLEVFPAEIRDVEEM